MAHTEFFIRNCTFACADTQTYRWKHIKLSKEALIYLLQQLDGTRCLKVNGLPPDVKIEKIGIVNDLLYCAVSSVEFPEISVSEVTSELQLSFEAIEISKPKFREFF